MHSILLRKVRSWAALTGGLFRSEDGGFSALPPEDAPALASEPAPASLFVRVESSAWPRQVRVTAGSTAANARIIHAVFPTPPHVSDAATLEPRKRERAGEREREKKERDGGRAGWREGGEIGRAEWRDR